MDLFAQLVDQYDTLKYRLLEAQTFDPNHFGFPELYYRIMESDQKRINAFKRAFKHYDFSGATVCEAGVGTLALAQHYLPVVKKAYLIENNPALIPPIKQILAQKGWSHKVELVQADARTVLLPEAVDFVVGELMSICCANEMQVGIFQHLRQFLKPQGRLLPERIINTVQLVQADVSSAPHYPINFTRHWPEVLSAVGMINSIDLYNEVSNEVTVATELPIWLDGVSNAVLLRSLIQITPGINFTGTDSLMPPTVCRLQNEQAVKAGNTISLCSHIRYGTSLDQASFYFV